MKKFNNLVLFTIFVLGIFLFLDSNSYVVEADTPEKKSVFIVDSMTEDLLYEQFLFSTITTFKELRPNSAYKFFSLSSPHESFEIISNQNDSKIYIDELKKWLKSLRDKQQEDTRIISGALGEAINELNVTNASDGSTINLVLFDELKNDQNEQKIVQSMIDGLSNNNWKLNVIHKYGATKSILDMYSNWSTWGQGVLQPIVVPDTIELLVERILQDNAERILKKDFGAKSDVRFGHFWCPKVIKTDI